MCVPLNVENISSRRNSFGPSPHFCQQNEHISVKVMKRAEHVQSCQLFLGSTFIKLVKSEPIHTNQLARKELRQYEGLKLYKERL